MENHQRNGDVDTVTQSHVKRFQWKSHPVLDILTKKSAILKKCVYLQRCRPEW